ncbi:hypothetical protein APY04_0741 [Hyphomicrobium sulfonivorans]|uniref:Glyoxalase/fosfomycin resistance/dioxygenase domain-containing protein n=1 Tax=Hyphomicrobium sulfonivorans TaxID=121290 RepID=A0A109BLP5_HYPSL|nr:VOC family protein [Hyphomicrobium sulfonivorans]KWT71079.1 hypothetical protein APY04_0741 [Hyphomicrobium sulfonivorans]
MLKSGMIPSLRARDLGATIDFYQRLGFALKGIEPCGGPPQWCALGRDDAVLHFHVMDLDGQSREPALSGTLYIPVDDVDRLASAWAGLTPLLWGPEDMPYGWREFAICDPNGYTLGFFQKAHGQPASPEA